MEVVLNLLGVSPIVEILNTVKIQRSAKHPQANQESRRLNKRNHAGIIMLPQPNSNVVHQSSQNHLNIIELQVSSILPCVNKTGDKDG